MSDPTPKRRPGSPLPNDYKGARVQTRRGDDGLLTYYTQSGNATNYSVTNLLPTPDGLFIPTQQNFFTNDSNGRRRDFSLSFTNGEITAAHQFTYRPDGTPLGRITTQREANRTASIESTYNSAANRWEDRSRTVRNPDGAINNIIRYASHDQRTGRPNVSITTLGNGFLHHSDKTLHRPEGALTITTDHLGNQRWLLEDKDGRPISSGDGNLPDPKTNPALAPFLTSEGFAELRRLDAVRQQAVDGLKRSPIQPTPSVPFDTAEISRLHRDGDRIPSTLPPTIPSTGTPTAAPSTRKPPAGLTR
ncbi:MAG: hypothetical protein SFW65_07775 [Alphaproteobacteria bacterium]|nr:hypothetical protein [Alphaproteobacteria bacterium]